MPLRTRWRALPVGSGHPGLLRVQFARTDEPRLWRRRVGTLAFIGVPVLACVIVLMCRALGLDSRGDVSLGNLGAITAFSLLWAFPLAIIAPTALARLSRRLWSRQGYACRALLLDGGFGVVTGVLLFGPLMRTISLCEGSRSSWWWAGCGSCFLVRRFDQ